MNTAEPMNTAEASPSDPSSFAAAQLVEHVDEDGTVLGIVTRAEMRKRNLRHRSVYIVVRSSADEVLVHRRADWKDVYPGAWDLAFGGVCDPGESWESSARRELLEEAGLVAELVDRGAVSHSDDEYSLIARVYSCVSDGPFAFNDGEVTSTRWIPRSELPAFLNEHEIPIDSRTLVAPLIEAFSGQEISSPNNSSKRAT